MNRVGTFCLSSDCQLPFITSHPFSGIATECCIHSCRLTVTRRVPHVEHELLTLPEYLSSTPVFSGIRVGHSLAFLVMFCRSLFVLLSFFNLRLLITSLWYLQTCLTDKEHAKIQIIYIPLLRWTCISFAQHNQRMSILDWPCIVL
jgi:hypothetical protein